MTAALPLDGPASAVIEATSVKCQCDYRRVVP